MRGNTFTRYSPLTSAFAASLLGVTGVVYHDGAGTFSAATAAQITALVNEATTVTAGKVLKGALVAAAVSTEAGMTLLETTTQLNALITSLKNAGVIASS